MATDLQDPIEPSTTALVGGIVDDLQDLLKQQILLTRMEISKEIQNVAHAIAFFAIGGGVLFFGAFFVCFGLIHLLHWSSAAVGSDPARIPLWVCHLVLGVPLMLIGGVFAWLGGNRLRSINPLHNPAAEALKENVKWATNHNDRRGK